MFVFHAGPQECERRHERTAVRRRKNTHNRIVRAFFRRKKDYANFQREDPGEIVAYVTRQVLETKTWTIWDYEASSPRNCLLYFPLFCRCSFLSFVRLFAPARCV